MTWTVVEAPGGQHVVPVHEDTVEHVTRASCPCRPTKTRIGCDHGVLMIHFQYVHHDEAERIEAASEGL